MNFGDVLQRISTKLEAENCEFALVGGLALSTFGFARATLDLDLLVPSSVQDSLIAFMEELGYRTLHRSSGFSNHLHEDPHLGRVDFVYVRGETRDRVFRGALPAEGPGGVEVLVPRAEHIAAMKVLAMKNDSDRRHLEMADIARLLQLPRIDRAEIRGYFERHGMLGLWDEFEE